MPWSAATRKANKATTGDLAVCLPPARVISDKNFFFSVKVVSDLCDDERAQIWHILEENMREFYISSSFGWDPRKKKKEMFNSLSRFIIVRHSSDPTGLVAYSIFRFEREDRQNVVYCYELQVLKASRRFGFGRLLVQTLFDIGAQWDMSKIMLTVFKANDVAMAFYESTGFTPDETSPDFSGDAEGECDYSILSRRIP